jgi:hypothetical protein
VLQANLDAALIVEENFLLLHNGPMRGIKGRQDIKFIKKQITTEYLDEDDSISKGDYSMIRPDFEESTDLKTSRKDS